MTLKLHGQKPPTTPKSNQITKKITNCIPATYRVKSIKIMFFPLCSYPVNHHLLAILLNKFNKILIKSYTEIYQSDQKLAQTLILCLYAKKSGGGGGLASIVMIIKHENRRLVFRDNTKMSPLQGFLSFTAINQSSLQVSTKPLQSIQIFYRFHQSMKKLNNLWLIITNWKQ